MSADTIRWHDRMEARVAAGILLLVTLSVAAVVVTATRVATNSAVARAARDLQDAQSAFYRLVDERAEVAARQTKLIIELPVFRSLMIDPAVASDVATLTQMADTYRQSLNAQFSIVSAPDGTPMALPGWPQGADMPAAFQAILRRAGAGESIRDIVAIDGALVLVTAEPARFSEAEVLGSVTFGFAIDDRVAEELSHITRADVSFVSGNRLAGSSLSADEQKEIAAAILAGGLRLGAGISREVRTIHAREFVQGTFPLFRDRATDVGYLVLLQDWAPARAFLDELRRALLMAGIGGFGLALAGGLFFSRRTSKPLMDMAAAARQIAGGDWSRTVAAHGSAEATTMAVAFNDMTRSLREHSERLRAAYQRFSTVTQSARDAIVSTDDSGNITFWNRSAESIFGYAEQEVLGQRIAMLIAKPDRAAFNEAMPQPVAGDLTFGRIVEVTGLRKDGGRFSCEFSLAVLSGPDGTSCTAVVRDVTERKQSQEALRQRDEQLRQAQKMEAIGRLAGGVAHDFNNLLMAIHGYAEMLAQSLPESDERREDAQEILKASDRASGLTRQLLAFSRREVITQQAVALDELVQGMQSMLQRLIGAEIQIHTEIWPDLAPVLADRTQIEQILVNLIINARDAMPNGGSIVVELRNVELDKIGAAAHPGLQPGDYVEMAVRDSGSGMDADTVSRIFEPFFTTKEAGKGTGLGLATVYGIVQQNNGAIEVQSRVGHGTTFYIYLPRATDLGQPAPIKPAARSVAGSETILLVDDDDRVRALVAHMLRKHGYTVLLASAADQALEIAARHHGHIHLLLTDVVMPGISGRVLAERLMATHPNTRVLYMSGYSDDAILRHGIRKNAAHFIQKPFSIDALAHKVREALDAPGNVPGSENAAGSRLTTEA